MQPLAQALVALSQVSGVGMAYDPDILPDRMVQADLADARLGEVLDDWLMGTRVTYRVVGQQIILTEVIPREYTISGLVVDATDGELLTGADVYQPLGSRGSTTNEYGFFSLTVPEGRQRIAVSYLGYADTTLYLEIRRNTRLRLQLQPEYLEIATATITPLPDTTLLVSTRSDASLALPRLRALPTLGGEPDLLRTLQVLPGVQTAADGLGGIHVRGGGTDQNLVLLDDAPVYYPTHALGLYSVFDMESIRRADWYTHGIPTRYGNRLSSVLDVRTREGDKSAWHGRLHIGTLTSRLSLEGPLQTGRTSVLLTGRVSHAGLVFGELGTAYFNNQGVSGDIDYLMHDVLAKINHVVDDRNRLYLSFYGGGDQYQDDTYRRRDIGIDTVQFVTDTMRIDWRNTLLSFRWNHILNSNLFINTTATYSQFRYANRYDIAALGFINNALVDEQRLYYYFQSHNDELALRSDAYHRLGRQHLLRYGGSVARQMYRPGIVTLSVQNGPISGTDEDFESLVSVEYAAYLQDAWQLSPQWQADIGLRFTGFAIDEANYMDVLPRIGLRYRPSRAWQWEATYDRTVQYLHLLVSGTIEGPADLWIPATADIPPQRGEQYHLGVQRMGRGWEASTALYYRTMHNIAMYRDGFLIAGLAEEDWRFALTRGRGEAYGWETQAQWQQDRVLIAGSYTLAYVDRQAPDVFFGQQYPYAYDRRHQVHAQVVYDYTERWQFAASFNYGSGLPTTLAQGSFTFSGTSPDNQIPLIDLGGKNAFRLPAYHRADVSARYTRQLRTWRWTAAAQVYNVYNRRNALYFRAVQDGDDRISFRSVSVLPLLPSLSLDLRF